MVSVSKDVLRMVKVKNKFKEKRRKSKSETNVFYSEDPDSEIPPGRRAVKVS